jgi:hypothetical protein
LNRDQVVLRHKEIIASADTYFAKWIKGDGIAKSLLWVIPDLIRNPEVIEKTGFRPPP